MSLPCIPPYPSPFSGPQEEWLTCQRNWLYLESIFSAPDIQRQLPAEAKMFMTVDKSYKEIMRKVNKMPLAIRAGTQPGLLETLQNNNALLDQIMKCLEAYLESKRVIFPRWEWQHHSFHIAVYMNTLTL